MADLPYRAGAASMDATDTHHKGGAVASIRVRPAQDDPRTGKSRPPRYVVRWS